MRCYVKGKRVRSLILLFIGFLVVGKSMAIQPEIERDEVSVYLAWNHQFQFAGYYAAKELGYYNELGLEVTLAAGTHLDNVEAVLTGAYTYAVGTGGMLLSNENIEELVILAVIFQQSPVTLLTLRKSEIQTLKDLEGKSIVGGTEIRLMLASADVDVNQVTFQGLFTNPDNLINGNLDAISYYKTDHLRILGSDSLLFKTFRPIEYGVNFYGECLFTSQKEVATNPDRVQRFVTATLKGWEYAVAEPDAVIDIMLRKYNSGLTRSELEQEAEITIHSLIQPTFYDIGDMQVSKWNQMAELLVQNRLIEAKPDLTKILYIPPNSSTRFQALARTFWISLGVGGLILVILVLYNWSLKKAVRSRTESLQKINSELDRFVYSVSHDIKSPLSSIQGLVNLMRVDRDGKDKYLDLIESSIIQLNKFTSDILEYSRNSRVQIENTPTDVNELIESVFGELRHLDNNEEVQLIKSAESGATVITDQWRLRVIVSNLISNAIKYRDPVKEKPFVKVSWTKKNDELELTVEDNGQGIEPEHLEKICDMFYRATSGSTGSGLGLYIVSETLKVLEGSLDIRSEPGKGTTIKVFIPTGTGSHYQKVSPKVHNEVHG